MKSRIVLFAAAVALSASVPSIAFAAATVEKPQNAGAPFNASGYYDFEITFSTDGNTAVWASNRPGGQGGNDVYFAEFKDGAWGPAQNFGPAVNSGANEQEAALSDDGELLYFTRYHDPDDLLSGDLYVSRKVDGVWQEAQSWNEVPELPSLNTPDGEEHCPVIAHKDLIYFSANREGTRASDIWKVERKNGVWGEPVSLGDGINSPARDHIHWSNLSKDGKALIVISERTDGGSFGGSDEWIARMDENGNWGTPVNLGPSINSAGDEICWTFSPDGKFIGATDVNGIDQGGALHFVRDAVLRMQGFEPDTNAPINLLKAK